MARALLRLVGIVLVLALGACSGCAGRRTDDAARPPAPPAAAEEAPTQPTPVPTVRPELACTTDADCTSTPFARPVADAASCYCPTCPAPLAARQASANEAAWQATCGAEWEARARCQAPMCRRPGPVGCSAGACTWRIDPTG